MFNLFRKKPEYPILICGLNGAGKTALLNKVSGHSEDAVLARPRGDNNGGHHTSVSIDTCGVKLTFWSPDRSDQTLEHELIRDILKSGDFAMLFIHHVTNPRLEDSVQHLHCMIHMLLEYGGRGVWVVLNKHDLPPEGQESVVDVGCLTTRFGLELSQYKGKFRWTVLDLPGFSARSGDKVQDLLKALVSELGQAPGYQPPVTDPAPDLTAMSVEGREELLKQVRTARDSTEAETFWDAFLHGSIVPWRHRDYLRAAFLTLLRPEHRDWGLPEEATEFADRIHRVKQRGVLFRLQPESRTMTVFWLYHVELAIEAYHRQLPPAQQDVMLGPDDFQAVLQHMPELLVEKLPEIHYSADLLRSRDAQNFWTLPDLHRLAELPPYPAAVDPQFGQQLTRKQLGGDPERLLRHAFAVVQRCRYDSGDQRRSWFLNLAFAALQQHTIRLRITDPSIEPYSVTQAYLYIALVHAALAHFDEYRIRHMAYPAFKQLFPLLAPTVWTRYYSPKLWYSVEARAAFVPPDLRPLPDRIDARPPPVDRAMNGNNCSSEAFRRRGHVPEIPPAEVQQFHLAVTLEEAKTAPVESKHPVSMEMQSHGHLIRYIHSRIASHGEEEEREEQARQALSALLRIVTEPSPEKYLRSSTQAIFWVNQVLHGVRQTNLPQDRPGWRAPTPAAGADIFRPSYTDNEGKWHRFHNCPCHADEEMPDGGIGPDALNYPHDFPSDYPPRLGHGCNCHQGLELDEQTMAKYVELCAAVYRQREEYEKQATGVIAGARMLSKDPWEDFIRFNPLLAWEGLWGAYYSSEGWGIGQDNQRKWIAPYRQRMSVLVLPDTADGDRKDIVQDSKEEDKEDGTDEGVAVKEESGLKQPEDDSKSIDEQTSSGMEDNGDEDWEFLGRE